MSLVNRRLFSIVQPCLQHTSHPRFVDTIKETSKPAQERSYEITRPIGLESPVLLNHKLSDTYSLSNVGNELFGAQAKERRQKYLDYDLKHSPIFDAKSFRNTNGKIFTPPISWFKSEKSLYFPDFVAKTLIGDKESLYGLLRAKYSIVRLFSSVTGDECTKTYFKVDNNDFYTSSYAQFTQEFPKFQIIDINMPTSWIKGFILSLSLSNLKKTIPPERWNQYFILPNHLLPPDIREKLHCDNQCSGYIYIVDSVGKIRWATSGYATTDDLKLMWKVVRGLSRESTNQVL
ncbi:ATP10 [Candida oxycetoniae]|uniref:ATP10 n=1 Tax=Candida oxycetoniae TaxID=497107 RepID=A0AAI9WW27_9ASCO|nr:ATP10 [Candida oxycetoniae]KAI3402302.2 ATP10 [Candida oxycetoniae]